MLFRDLPDGSWLAVSQPMHALVSGQMMRAWGAPGFARPEPFEEVVTAAAQHDVAWMDWEAAPTFDAATGRPHVFRSVGARLHAPMWAEGVQRAAASWGPLVALLVSRHGSLIYSEFNARHQDSPEDAAAAAYYRASQAAMQEALAAGLGLAPGMVERASVLIGVTDALSLAACGGLATIGDVRQAPVLADGGMAELALRDTADGLAIAPWPFLMPELTVTFRAQRFAAGTRWTDEAAMRAALAAAPAETLSARLVAG